MKNVRTDEDKLFNKSNSTAVVAAKLTSGSSTIKKLTSTKKYTTDNTHPSIRMS